MSETKDIVRTEEKHVEKTRELRSAVPVVDIYENDDEFLLCVDMPGVLKEDISVNIDNGTLFLSGVRHLERKGVYNWEEFSDLEYVRRFSVPQAIDTDKVRAELKDGVLNLHLPKSEAARPKMIKIKAA
jgi:HSP20 family molecular chaperone IbpA